MYTYTYLNIQVATKCPWPASPKASRMRPRPYWLWRIGGGTTPRSPRAKRSVERLWLGRNMWVSKNRGCPKSSHGRTF